MDRIVIQIKGIEQFFVVNADEFITRLITNSERVAFCEATDNKVGANQLFTINFSIVNSPDADFNWETKTINIKGPLEVLRAESLQAVFKQLVSQMLPLVNLFALDLSVVKIQEKFIGIYFADKDSLFFERKGVAELFGNALGLNSKALFGLNIFDKELRLVNQSTIGKNRLSKIIILNSFSTISEIKLLEKPKAKHIISSYMVSNPLLQPVVIPEWGFLFHPFIESQNKIERYDLISNIAGLPMVKIQANMENLIDKIVEACRI